MLNSILNEKVGYRKQIAGQHSCHKYLARAGGWIRMLCVILCGRM